MRSCCETHLCLAVRGSPPRAGPGPTSYLVGVDVSLSPGHDVSEGVWGRVRTLQPLVDCGCRSHVRVASDLESEYQIVARKRLAILPPDARAQVPVRLHRPIRFDAPGASLDRRQFDRHAWLKGVELYLSRQ